MQNAFKELGEKTEDEHEDSDWILEEKGIEYTRNILTP